MPYVVPFGPVSIIISPKDLAKGTVRIRNGKARLFVTVLVAEEIVKSLTPGTLDDFEHARVEDVRPPAHVVLSFESFDEEKTFYLPDVYWRPTAG